MQIPAAIIRGDTVTWRDRSTRDSLGNTIDSSWTLTWSFAGPTTLSVTSTAYDTGWQTDLSTVETGGMTEGDYWWSARASLGGKIITIGSGQIKVVPALAEAEAGYDGRSDAEVSLQKIRDVIKSRLDGGAVLQYWIGTRRLWNEPLADLLKLETRYKLIVANERRAKMMANGLGDPKNTYVRFG